MRAAWRQSAVCTSGARHHTGLHPAARVGQDAEGQGRFVVEQPAQRRSLRHQDVDVATGAGRAQLTRAAFALPASSGRVQQLLGQQPQRLAEQGLASAGLAVQGDPRQAQLVGQALHVESAARAHPAGRARDGPGPRG